MGEMYHTRTILGATPRTLRLFTQSLEGCVVFSLGFVRLAIYRGNISFAAVQM